VNEFALEIGKFLSKLDGINSNPKLNDDKKNERKKEALGPVTSVYKQNFVAIEKFNEFFHVALLMINELQTEGAKYFSCVMRLANSLSAEIISRYIATLFYTVECGKFKADVMEVFNAYFGQARMFPTDLDIHEMDVAKNGLRPFIEKRTDTNT
jgi:hypothetical protein